MKRFIGPTGICIFFSFFLSFIPLFFILYTEIIFLLIKINNSKKKNYLTFVLERDEKNA